MKPVYHEYYFTDAGLVNPDIVSAYTQKLEAGEVRKSHLFAGRYENIYIDRNEIPGLSVLISFWIASAAWVLNKPQEKLRCGFWFNDMQPGDVTQPHSHDDDDELLSGVYYLKVPQNSGDLVLHEGEQKLTVTPQAGKLVLFSASNVHEVTKNLSQQVRLSIGINFGLDN